VAMLWLGVLGMTNALSAAWMLPIVAAASLTFPLSVAGTRSLFPTVIPRDMWDMGNAVDSGSDALSAVLGPPLAGGLVAWLGGPGMLLVTAGVYVCAALSIVTVPAQARSVDTAPRVPLLRAAFAGLLYVVRNPSLRGLAVVMSVGNLGYGQLYVILPVLVLQRYNGGAAMIGALWAVQGAAAVASGVVMGRLGSERRERRLLALGFLVLPLGFALFAMPWEAALVVGLVVSGVVVGPIDIALFSLRQRRTDPAWFGRAFAVSMALNFAGMPIGSAIAGPLVSVSTGLALGVAAALSFSAALLCRMIPRDAAVAAGGAAGPASSAGDQRLVDVAAENAEQTAQ
jgi:predicted MFS family arabinose efflux permease